MVSRQVAPPLTALDLLGLFADVEADDAEMADALCAAAEDDAHEQEQLPDAADEPGAGSPLGTSGQQMAATPMVRDCLPRDSAVH